MRRLFVTAILGSLVSACSHSIDSSTPVPYPQTRLGAVVESLHGNDVPDPYRWLEDLDSQETRDWVAAQNSVTYPYLEGLEGRGKLRQELTRLWNYERFGLPEKVGDSYFFTRNDGLQNQSVLYVTQGLQGEARVLLDPNAFSEDGTIALSGAEVSPDGTLLAYGISSGGSDWQEWRVRDVATGRDLPDRVKWVKFSGASWSGDSRGFYYSRYDEPEGDILEEANYFQKIYFHAVGNSQDLDTLIYQRKDQKEWGFNGHVSHDGRYLIITVRQGTDTRNRVYYRDLQTDAPVVELLDDFDANYVFVGNRDNLFWFKTDLEAPRGRLVQIDIRRPERSSWVELVGQSENTLRSVSVLHDSLILSYLKDAHSSVEVRDLEGNKVQEIALPGLGSAGGFGGKPHHKETFYSFTSFTVPTSIYHYDMTSGTSTVFRAPRVDFDPSLFETRQVFYQSKDGTRIPMFVTHRKGLELDGTHPTLLYGYGGFNISLTPSFSVQNATWIRNGGVYAVPNLRGGGEYGREWHQAGMKLKKQNVFDDFIAAAEWLISEGYTSSRHLAIAGGSNGGLLVGACMTQRPELFGAALPAVGVMDMLRFHKFTIGWAWVSDYGSPDDPEEFKALRAYSPYHNIRDGIEYPPTLITTADHDDRVVPSHSFKFAARLQAAQSGPSPVLIRVETRAGHGAGKPTSMRIEEASDRLAFLLEHLR